MPHPSVAEPPHDSGLNRGTEKRGGPLQAETDMAAPVRAMSAVLPKADIRTGAAAMCAKLPIAPLSRPQQIWRFYSMTSSARAEHGQWHSEAGEPSQSK